MHSLEEKARSLGYPHARLTAKVVYSPENSLLAAKSGVTYVTTWKVVRIVENGIIIGGGSFHEQLIEWVYVSDIY